MGTVYRAAQLTELGITRHRRDTMLAEGRLHLVEHGVYSTAQPEGTLLLTGLSLTRPHLVYSGPTARAVFDGTPPPSPAHGLVARPHAYRSTPRLTVRQVRTLPFRTVDGHRVVPPAAAVSDLLIDAPGTAREFLEKHYGGRHGNALLAGDLAAMGRTPPALRTVLAGASIASDSKSEQKLARALKARRVTLVQNFRLGHYHWDVALPAAKILIDVDSYRYHGAHGEGDNERTFIIDRWKANDGARRGWLVLHYTGECIYRHLDKVVDQIMDTVAWRLAGGPPPQQLPCEVKAPWLWHTTLRHTNDDEPPWPTSAPF